MDKEFKPLTDVERKNSSTKNTPVNILLQIIGAVLFASGFVSVVYFNNPHWVNFALFIGGGYLAGKGKGAL